MPESEAAFQVAKTSILSNIRTSRTTGASVLNEYLNLEDLGLTEDRDKAVFEKVQGMTLADVKATQEKWVKGRTYAYGLLGNSAGARHLKGAFHHLLAAHFGEIEWILARGAGKLLASVDHGGLQDGAVVEECYHFLQAVDAIYIDIINNSCLGGIGAGHYEALKSEFACQNSHRQHAFHGLHGAIEREFAHEHKIFEPICCNGWRPL